MTKTMLLINNNLDDKEIFRDAFNAIDPSLSFISASSWSETNCLLTKQLLLPDLIFLDLNLPVTSGKECFVKLKNIGQIAHVPVIMFAISSASQHIDETLKLGASFFLTKPCCFNNVCQTLTIVLNKQLRLENYF